MCEFKPGDEVVWVDADGVPELTAGASYTIAEAYGVGLTVSTGVLEPGVTLREVRNPRAYGYRASRFRKVARRADKLGLTEWLAQPSCYDEEQHSPAPKAPAKRERVQ